MKKLVAIDLDGTLLHSDCTISDHTKEVIAEACAAGIMVVPTSGRSFRSIKEQVRDIEGIQYCVCANGTVVADVHTEEIISYQKIEPVMAYEIYKDVCARDGFIEIYNEVDAYVENDRRHVIYDTKLSRAFCDNLLSTDIPILSANLLMKKNVLQPNKYHIAFADPKVTKDFCKTYQEKQELTFTFPSEYNLEIFPGGCNKDEGIRVLCEKFNIAREDTVAIGDSDNDLSMIQYAHRGLAVSNAMNVLKESADAIIPSNDEDGPASVLEELLQEMQEVQG